MRIGPIYLYNHLKYYVDYSSSTGGNKSKRMVRALVVVSTQFIYIYIYIYIYINRFIIYLAG